MIGGEPAVHEPVLSPRLLSWLSPRWRFPPIQSRVLGSFVRLTLSISCGAKRSHLMLLLDDMDAWLSDTIHHPCVQQRGSMLGSTMYGKNGDVRSS